MRISDWSSDVCSSDLIYLASSICCRTGNRLSFGKYAFRYDAVVVFDVIPLTGPADATMFFIPSEQGIGKHARMGSVPISSQHEVAADLGIQQHVQAEILKPEGIIPSASEPGVDIANVMNNVAPGGKGTPGSGHPTKFS